ncbi:MAG: hypothetical protein QME90_01590 [Thermodesulfobacteriota bacterium]|nr:hypothetical protein [Thermodesulfobacteriota bacterium]
MRKEFTRSWKIKLCGSLCALLVLTFVWVNQSNSENRRKYSIMSVEEASEIVSRIIQTRKQEIKGWYYKNPFSSWSLPKGGIISRGVKIDDKDYVVWAAAQPDSIRTTYRSAFSAIAPNIKESTIESVLNGIFVTSVDLEVLKKPTQIIEKSGYEWWVGPHGIILSLDNYIFFEEPIKDFSMSPPTIYVVEFSLLPGENAGFAIHVKDKVIQFK